MDASDVLAKLPLLDAFWRVWREALPPEVLESLYEEHRGACYERQFGFGDLVRLVHDAMSQHGGRALPALTRPAAGPASTASELPGSIQAFYGKIGRMPPAVSRALVGEGAKRLAEFLPASARPGLPDCFRDHRLLVFDGKTLKHAAKRLLETRSKAGRAIGGKLLAVRDPGSGLIVGFAADPDGHRNEQRLVPPMLDDLRPQLPGRRIWIADAEFGNLANFAKAAAEGDDAILRAHPHTVFAADPASPAVSGTDATGRAFTDAVGAISSTRHGARAARRIAVARPGADDFVVLTSLLDRDAYPAEAVLDVYRERWSIEEAFQNVVELFHLRRLIGSRPPAMIFQSAICLTLFNVLAVVRAILADTQSRPADEISMCQVNEGLHRDLTACHRLLEAADLAPYLAAIEADAARTREQRRETTRTLLARAWKPHRVKRPTKKRHLPKQKHSRGQPAHFSIHKAILEHRKDV